LQAIADHLPKVSGLSYPTHAHYSEGFPGNVGQANIAPCETRRWHGQSIHDLLADQLSQHLSFHEGQFSRKLSFPQGQLWNRPVCAASPESLTIQVESYTKNLSFRGRHIRRKLTFFRGQILKVASQTKIQK